MKKILLALAFGIAQWSNAQLTCATATAATAGTNTAPAITGTYQTSCDTTNGDITTPHGIWYSYTPTSNGQLVISSDLATNDGTTNSDDTRVSVYSGSCGSLTCVGGNDDISSTNYLSSLSLNVNAGTTYYIQWDDRWSALGFDWTLTFTAISCMPVDVNSVTITNITSTGATINWTAAVGSPASYDIEYGVSGFTQGTGTIVNSTTTSKTLSSLTAGGDYDFYIRSNCGTSQSTWVGPVGLYLAKSLPYSTNLDTNASLYGLTTSGWGLSTTSANAQSAPNYLFANSSTTAATAAKLYSRALNLASNEIVTLTFYTRISSGTATPHTLKVYTNTTPSTTGATQIGTTLTVNYATYTQTTITFSVPTSGIYYVIFSDETPIVTTASSLRLDTIALSSVLGTSEVSLDNTLAIYPNPASDVLNIKTKGKVKSITVYDLSGRRINAEVIDNKIDVKNFQSGTYLIDIETTLGKSFQKFIKK